MSKEISNADDIIDSRDVIERIAELEADEERTEDESEELAALQALAEEASQYAPDWEYGVRDSYFEEYARELADDIGAMDRNANWPLCHIDWEAAADSLKMDYTSVDFDGVTYWVR